MSARRRGLALGPLLAASLLSVPEGEALGQPATAPRTPAAAPGPRGGMVDHPYVGMWVTGDGRVRQELLANGRYDEARGDRQSAYQGRYEVEGTRIAYRDDTGFTADGTFVSDDELHHGGMILFRER